jgi:hypothetical protein
VLIYGKYQGSSDSSIPVAVSFHGKFSHDVWNGFFRQLAGWSNSTGTHRVFETWPASRQAETTATQQQQSLKHVGSAECKSCQNCIEEQTHINALSANTKVQDSKCSDDFNLCFSSPGNQQLTRSSRNHHSTGSYVTPLWGPIFGWQQRTAGSSRVGQSWVMNGQIQLLRLITEG